MKQSIFLIGLLLTISAASMVPGASPPSTPPGGIVKLYSFPEDSANLTKNGSFEEVAAGQAINWVGGVPNRLFPTTATTRSRQRSLQLTDAPNARYTLSLHQSFLLDPGWYTLRVWLKAEALGEKTKDFGARASLWFGGTHVATPVMRGTFDWTKSELRNIQIGIGQSKAEVRLEAYGSPTGTVYFDDVEVRRLVPPLVEAFLRYPNYRGYLFDDRPQTIALSIKVNAGRADRLSELVIRVRLAREGSAGTLIARDHPAGAAFTVQLDGSAVPHGAYVLTVEAVRRSTGAVLFAYPSYRIVKAPASVRNAMRVAVDHDQVLLLGGQRVFPIGIFDTSAASPSTAFWEPRFKKIAEAPMSIYINYHQGNEGEQVLDALMTAAQRHGIFYLHTTNAWYEDHPYWPRKLMCERRSADVLGADGIAGCMARALRNHPGLAGWYVADEAPADQVEQMFGQYRVLRENAPGGIALIAQNAPRDLVRWRDTSDVFAVDPFPLWGNYPEGTLAPLEMVTEWMEHAHEGVERSRPVWGDIQFFQATAGGRWPTRDDLRTMSYMAIVTGARGLIYWSYGARALAWVKDPALREEYWQRLVSVTREIKALEPALLSPDAPEILARHVPAGPVRVLAKRVGDVRYVIAVNNTPKKVQATFTLAGAAGTVEVVNESRALVASAQRTFGDGFEPYAVHVYRIGPQ